MMIIKGSWGERILRTPFVVSRALKRSSLRISKETQLMKSAYASKSI